MSKLKMRGSVIGFILLFGAPATAVAQGAGTPTTYVAVDCMKSTAPDYASVETDIWQPMHQELVRQGKKSSWSLLWVLYGDRSQCDYYTVNTYVGESQLNDDTPFSEVFARVHPGKSWQEASARTGASREMVWSELWTIVDAVLPEDFLYAHVNQMYANDGAAYESIEREVYKPVHEALVAGGHSAGWAAYELVTPSGTSLPYNYATVDFGNRLGPIPFFETIRAVHPGMEVAAINQRTQAIREIVRTETWIRIAATQGN